MNNKGQTLVLFLLILPLIIIAIAYLIDNSIIWYEKNRLNNISDIALEYCLTNQEKCDEIKIKEMVLKNDQKITEITLTKTDSEINIKLLKSINSIFGNIAGIDQYDILVTDKRIIE